MKFQIQENKICKLCIVELPIDKFEILYPNPINRLKKPSIRNKCKKCKVEENRKRIAKDPDFYKKQYRSMSEEKRAIYIKKKSLQNCMRPNITEKRKRYNRSDIGIYNRYTSDSKRRNRASRGIEMLLTLEEFSVIINSNCAYCNSPNCRGIDRIDSSKSYTKDNSNPCCKICNIMKSNLSLLKFKEHIKKIYNKIGMGT